jgi:serine protease Do
MNHRLCGARMGRGIAVAGLLVVWLVASVIAAAGERNTYAVRNAFREAIGQPARSTVQILCDGRRAALGVIVDAQGYILTKASELHGTVVCLLYDGRRLPAKTVGFSDLHDLALLKIDVRDLPAIQWSDGQDPPVGSWLATSGLEPVPVSVGVVSVEPRTIEKSVAALGAIIEEGEEAPRVHLVVPESGADRAGIKADDVITHFNGKRVDNRESLIQTIREHRPGDKVRLRVLRDKKEFAVDAVLMDLAELHGADPNGFPEDIGGRLSTRRTGFPLVFQHDTVLQPNQCGGPVVDLDGKTVGINIARASRVASYAIPSRVAKEVAQELRSGKLVSALPAD